MSYDETVADRIRRLLSERNVAEMKMFGGLCFMVDGHLCCCVGKTGLLVRVGPDVYERAVNEPHVAPMTTGTRTMAGFVRVAPAGFRTPAALAGWVGRGLAVVATLPAKTPRSPSQKRSNSPTKRASSLTKRSPKR